MNKLVPSQKNDLTAIAKCHKLCFKHSLSSRLGLVYIKKTFEWFLEKENRFLFHVVKDGEVIGYCGGFIPQYIGDGSTSGIMQYTMPQAIRGVALHPWLLFHKEVLDMHPLILKNIRRKIFKKKESKKVTEPVKPFDKRVGLVVIGVHPEHRGSGVFQLLMHEFEARALSFNINKLVLSVKKSNQRAINAYSKQHWFISNEHPVTLEMCKHLQ